MERRVDGTEREAEWVSCARIRDNVGYEMLVEDKEGGGTCPGSGKGGGREGGIESALGMDLGYMGGVSYGSQNDAWNPPNRSRNATLPLPLPFTMAPALPLAHILPFRKFQTSP